MSQLNQWHACALEHLNDFQKQFNFVECMIRLARYNTHVWSLISQAQIITSSESQSEKAKFIVLQDLHQSLFYRDTQNLVMSVTLVDKHAKLKLVDVFL